MTIERILWGSCVALVAFLTGCASPPPRAARPVCVDFDPPQFLAGTQYPAPGQQAGAVIFIANGIRASIHPFLNANGSTTFGAARVEQPLVFFGTGQALRTINVALEFDFTALPFPPSQVSFAYLDLGGSENVAVNGSPVFVGQLPTTSNPIGGATVGVTQSAVTGGTSGTVTFSGAVKSLRVGGQEFWIDQVCARQ